MFELPPISSQGRPVAIASAAGADGKCGDDNDGDGDGVAGDHASYVERRHGNHPS